MDEYEYQNINTEAKEAEETKKEERRDSGKATYYQDVEYENHKDLRKKEESGVSIFVLGLMSLVLSWLGYFLLPIIGFVLGLIAVVRGNKPRKLEERPGFITAGWIMGIVGMVVCAVVAIANIADLVAVMAPFHFYYRHFYF